MKWFKRGASVLALAAMSLAMLPGAITGGAAQAASISGSIVFIKGHNVWLVRPDGSGLYQVTRDGTYAVPYRSPSMSDAGVIAAGHNRSIVRMRQNGQVLNWIDPLPLPNSVGEPTDGPPVGVSISPDGRRIAYTMANFTCPIGVVCAARSVTGVTDATALTPNRIGTNYYSKPSWITNTRLMTHGGYGSQVMLQDLGGAPQHWFDDSDVQDQSEDLGDGEVSRDGSRLAVVRSYGATTHLLTAVVHGNSHSTSPGSLPAPSYRCYTNNDARINSPSWGPDNRTLVVGDADGLVVITEGAECGAGTFLAIAPGGSAPYWSPAALNPGPRVNNSRPRSFALLVKPVVNGSAVVGKRLRATSGRWSPTPVGVSYRWLRNGKVVKGKAGARKIY